MAHSNQIREFILSSKGISLMPAYVGSGGVLTGTARKIQESRERVEAVMRAEERRRTVRTLAEKRRNLEGQIARLRAQFKAETEELETGIAESERREHVLEADQLARVRARGGHSPAAARGRVREDA
jgi:circadian clock protein KaiC